jgi:ubiquinone/menaquinone biosynthesis C-methylase UbiE
MSPLYTFLKYCENSRLQKEILDCGAGGKEPPLYIFHLLGYSSHGVDISEEQLKKARDFCGKKRVKLNIRKGDMRNLPFENCSFSFVYSYDTIFHMSKKEVVTAIEEMRRVLRREGLLFVNFVSTRHSSFGVGQEVGAGEFIQSGKHGKVFMSYYEDNEPDPLFHGFEILSKEKRIVELTRSGARALGFTVDAEKYIYASLDYFARKK